MPGLSKQLIKACIRHNPLSLLQSARSGLVPILRYHSLDCSGSCVSTPPDVWLMQLDYLERNGYRAVSLEEYFAAAPAEADDLVIMTFDDGYHNNFEQAFGELVKRGCSATFFVVPRCVGGEAQWLVQDLHQALAEGHEYFKATPETFCAHAQLDSAHLEQRLPDLLSLGRKGCLREIYLLNKITELPLMSWEQLRTMRQAGMEIGAHTLTHSNLNFLSSAQAREEIQGAKTAIEEELGTEVRFFCYPYGAVADSSAACVQKAGFLGACTCANGYYRKEDSPYYLRRIAMEKMDNRADVDLYINPRFRGWVSRLCRLRERL